MNTEPNKSPHHNEKISVIDKAALFNHIKKHRLCSDKKIIKYLDRLNDLCTDLKINFSQFQASKEELLSFQRIHQIEFSCFGDEAYPSSFYHLDNPPAIFYYSGKLELINQNYNLAIVGTRNSSLYGEHCCRTVVESLENYDVTFISGLARGIDLISHKTALSTSANSVAVIGSGLLAFAYFGEQKIYFEELKRRHLVISEFHPREHASRSSFAQRNRLIAALSNSTIVIEAADGSGALITAEHCLKLERGLYAIPGDLNKRSFTGSNKLLAQNKALPIFQASKTPFVLGLDYANTDAAFHKETRSKETSLNRIKEKVQKQILSPNSQKILEEEVDIKTNPYKSSPNQDPLIDLLDSGINDFDLLFFKSHYQSPTELVSHLTNLEIQGKISRRGALFVSN